MKHITDFICNVILALLWLIAVILSVAGIIAVIAFAVVAFCVGTLIYAVMIMRDGNTRGSGRRLFLKL